MKSEELKLQEIMKTYKMLTTDFVYNMELLKKWKNVTYEEISDRTHMSVRQIQRIFTGNSIPCFHTLCLILLSLNIPVIITDHIIKIAPYGFNSNNPNHFKIMTQVYEYSGKNIDMDEILDLFKKILIKKWHLMLCKNGLKIYKKWNIDYLAYELVKNTLVYRLFLLIFGDIRCHCVIKKYFI